TATVADLAVSGMLEPKCAEMCRTPPASDAKRGEPLSLFKHQEQPKYLYYPENPEWIFMDYISWGAMGAPDKFGPWFADTFWHQGDEIPGFASLSSTLGSTGDVQAKGNLDETTGVWSLELKRLFDPGNDDDTNLAQFDHLE
ncbi:MAG: hypothetical protein NTW26_04680, partial [bacterium]|nr:hypothetical protein [bacterium]